MKDGVIALFSLIIVAVVVPLQCSKTYSQKAEDIDRQIQSVDTEIRYSNDMDKISRLILVKDSLLKKKSKTNVYGNINCKGHGK